MISQLKAALWDVSFTYWKNEVLFSPRWWLLVSLIAAAYAVWWRLVDKSRLSRLLLFGSFMASGRIVMDLVGTNAGLWYYVIRELPLMPSPFLHDFTITPLAYMLVMQYSASLSGFFFLNAVASAAISFVFLPILGYLGILKLINWSYFYTFILIFAIAVLSRAVLTAILKLEKQSRRSEARDASARMNCQPAFKPLPEDEDD